MVDRHKKCLNETLEAAQKEYIKENKAESIGRKVPIDEGKRVLSVELIDPIDQ